MLGDSATAVKKSLMTLVPPDQLGTDDASRELSLMQLAAVWHACHALQTQFASRRAKMEEDPTKIPEMAQEDHAEFRGRFVRTHPDVVLLDSKEPHKKFVEKLSRDFLVHGMVPYYTVSEIRVRSDTISQKTGLTRTAEDLLTVSKADEPDQVTDVQTLLNRIHAFFMALEYCLEGRRTGSGHGCSDFAESDPCFLHGPGVPQHLWILAGGRSSEISARARTVQGRLSGPTVRDGGRCSHQKEGLPAAIRAEGNIRFVPGSFVGSDQQPQILVERCKAVLARVDRKEAPPVREADHVQEEALTKAASPNKNKRKRARNRELLKEAKQIKKSNEEKVRSPTKIERDKRIPETEWKTISAAASSVAGEKRCHFYNSSMGCSMGDKCRFKHSCMKCGAHHPMVGNH